jgi:hypothetical protein
VPLQFAESDASQVASTLVEVGGAELRNVRLLRGASLAAAESALTQLGREAGSDDLVLVFYSGHGSSRGAHLDGQVWPWSRIHAGLSNLRARVVVGFFYACSSGVLLAAKGGILRGPPLEIQVRPVTVRGHFLVTSSIGIVAAHRKTVPQSHTVKIVHNR